MKALFRLIVGIPVLLLAYVQSLIALVIALIAWFAILFTGKLSEGLFNPLRSALAYGARANGVLPSADRGLAAILARGILGGSPGRSSPTSTSTTSPARAAGSRHAVAARNLQLRIGGRDVPNCV